jgi:GNAT superfamily N-acetyltransferase
MFMDRELSCRLERVEGIVGLTFAEVNRARGAVAREVDGTYAFFDGVDSPLTQTFGLGMRAPVTADSLAELEAFFMERGADVMHEVSPFAGVAAIAQLVERGYRPCELSTVLVLPLDGARDEPPAPGIQARIANSADREVWIETSVDGWSRDATYASSMRTIATAAFANAAMVHMIVERAGAAIATGSLGICDDIALLAGASTIPAGRGLGAQTQLLTARLAEARRRGCTLAMMVADPGSTSQRNAERRGFRVAYTRTKWRLARRA